MLETEGIVLRHVRYKESSLILDILTEKLGFRSFIMNSVFNKGNQRLASVLQLMNIVELVCYYHENKTIHRIKEVRPSVLYQSIPYDIKRAAIGGFILELLRKTVKDLQTQDELYSFVRSSYLQLDESALPDPNFHISFMIQFTRYLGIMPTMDYDPLIKNSFDIQNGQFVLYNEQNQYHLRPDISSDLALLMNGQSIGIDSINRKQLLDSMILYYRMHIENFGEMKTQEIYKTVLH